MAEPTAEEVAEKAKRDKLKALIREALDDRDAELEAKRKEAAEKAKNKKDDDLLGL